VPDAHDPARRHAPMMTTADMALRADPACEAISRRFLAHPQAQHNAFARAWFKLTHRDMGPRTRYLGKLVPAEALIWQHPVPPASHPLVDTADIVALKACVLASDLSVSRPAIRRPRLPVPGRHGDRANLLTLTAPEMTVLVGGLRVLNGNAGGSAHGVTRQPGTLTNDFFVNLFDMRTVWRKSATEACVLEGRDRTSGALKWTGTVADLVFGSNSHLRALAEVHASSDARASSSTTSWRRGPR